MALLPKHADVAVADGLAQMGLRCSGGIKYSPSSEWAVSAAEKQCFDGWEPALTGQPGV